MFNVFEYNFVFLPCNTVLNLSPFPHSLPHLQIIYLQKSTQSAINPIKDSAGKSEYPQERGLWSQVSPGLTANQGLPHGWIFCPLCSVGYLSFLFSLPSPPALLPPLLSSALTLSGKCITDRAYCRTVLSLGSGYSNVVAKKNRIIFILLYFFFCVIAAWYFILWMK